MKEIRSADLPSRGVGRLFNLGAAANQATVATGGGENAPNDVDTRETLQIRPQTTQSQPACTRVFDRDTTSGSERWCVA